MFLRYFYDENLAQAAYLVGCPASGEALLIDPARHVQPYLETAAAHGLKIVAIAETHIHADFVSGARQLHAQTDATLLLSGEGGDDWQYSGLDDLPHARLKHGDTFEIGSLHFEVFHTPGHTPEHLTLLLSAPQPYALFTGDFVLVGGLGRPDLLEQSIGQVGSAQQLAAQMFRAVAWFKTLAPHLLVLPAHGAGSACGHTLGAVPSSTVGYELLTNPLLNINDEAAFSAHLLNEQTPPPHYFGRLKRLNQAGAKVLKTEDTPDVLPPLVLRTALENGAPVIDTRASSAFAEMHLPHTLNIPLNNRDFTLWAGNLISPETPFYVITDQPQEAIQALRAVGLDNLAGTFRTSVFSTIARSTKIPFVAYSSQSAKSLRPMVAAQEAFVLDVRRADEFNAAHIDGAHNIPLQELPARLTEIPHGQAVVVHCAAGYRSSIAASLLKNDGHEVINMQDGFVGWQQSQA